MFCVALPEIVKQTARKNYKLWKQNPTHPSLEFKKLDTKETVYSYKNEVRRARTGIIGCVGNLCLYSLTMNELKSILSGRTSFCRIS
ncbi:hypothetical protein AsFPU1_2496 [Aphanothece sacrum FPU1]|uniref:Uncharacterized protein n=1 Tax=Aphanothece sacrum FPU1 TaxID=1920663 RepID=A0A401IIQ5_APHSA|nr:hypothetical protein AsFPU1_2496 [Aphanothece sacrum FPU1]GBF85487.1 variable lymphocyte receptor diversity region [Aphanothece sacrum FPU3]